MAYFCDKALAFELRPGSQHSENGAIKFLDRCISIIDKLGIKREDILLRVDSGHDAREFLLFCNSLGIQYVIKRNIRNKKSFLHEEMPRIKLGFIPELTNDPATYVYRVVEKDSKIYKTKIEGLNVVYEFTEKYDVKNNQLYFDFDRDSPLFGREPWFEYGVDSYFTNIKVLDNSFNECTDDKRYCIECVNIYHDHATSEQFHSEIKSDMNMYPLTALR